MHGRAGSVRLTADSAVGNSGKPVRVYNVEMVNGGSAGVLVLRNGTADTDTIYVQKNGSAATVTDTFNWGEKGLYFPAGCFFDKDTNTAAVVVNFEADF